METVVRKVRDIDGSQRSALEKLVGHRLRENQQLVIQVLNVDLAENEPAPAAGTLPEWCNVYADLTPAQIADLESAIVRTPTSRQLS